MGTCVGVGVGVGVGVSVKEAVLRVPTIYVLIHYFFFIPAQKQIVGMCVGVGVDVGVGVGVDVGVGVGVRVSANEAVQTSIHNLCFKQKNEEYQKFLSENFYLFIFFFFFIYLFIFFFCGKIFQYTWIVFVMALLARLNEVQEELLHYPRCRFLCILLVISYSCCP